MMTWYHTYVGCEKYSERHSPKNFEKGIFTLELSLLSVEKNANNCGTRLNRTELQLTSFVLFLFRESTDTSMMYDPIFTVHNVGRRTAAVTLIFFI